MPDNYEYVVMQRSRPGIHRGPESREWCYNWIAEAEADGLRRDAFYVARRIIGEWEPDQDKATIDDWIDVTPRIFHELEDMEQKIKDCKIEFQLEIPEERWTIVHLKECSHWELLVLLNNSQPWHWSNLPIAQQIRLLSHKDEIFSHIEKKIQEIKEQTPLSAVLNTSK